jgi:endonuclease/exonuclease/phosphatase (EEP) superfamily protein YafD
MTNEVPASLTKPRPLWHWVLLACSLGPMACIISGQLSSWLWVGELASHWTLHAVICLLPVIIVFRRDPWWGRLFIILLLVGSWPWMRTAFAPRAVQVNPGSTLTIATANISVSNRQREEMYATLLALPVDILILHEVTSSDQSIFQASQTWPHQTWKINNGPFSMALLSKQRHVNSAFHSINGIPLLEALLDGGEVPLLIYAVHPPAPTDPDFTKQRNQYLAMLAQQLRDRAEPVLVAGDWNVTPGSHMWNLIINFSQVQPAPGARPATWPAALGPVGIPIDHILGRQVGLAPLQAFTIPGSDHRGLMTTVTLPATWVAP